MRTNPTRSDRLIHDTFTPALTACAMMGVVTWMAATEGLAMFDFLVRADVDGFDDPARLPLKASRREWPTYLVELAGGPLSRRELVDRMEGYRTLGWQLQPGTPQRDRALRVGLLPDFSPPSTDAALLTPGSGIGGAV